MSDTPRFDGGEDWGLVRMSEEERAAVRRFAFFANTVLGAVWATPLMEGHPKGWGPEDRQRADTRIAGTVIQEMPRMWPTREDMARDLRHVRAFLEATAPEGTG